MFWLMILPSIGSNLVTSIINPETNGFSLTEQGFPVMDLPPVIVFGIILMLIFALLVIWGSACTLVIGKRLLTNRAGRNRTSFRAVARQARRYILPLFLTSILRTCFVILWGLLLIIPGIIYNIRTVFYGIVIVCEGPSYRQALNRSKEVAFGHTWKILWSVIGLALCTFLPVSLLTAGVAILVSAIDMRLMIMTDILNGFFTGLATILFTLATIVLYSELKKQPKFILPPPPSPSRGENEMNSEL